MGGSSYVLEIGGPLGSGGADWDTFLLYGCNARQRSAGALSMTALHPAGNIPRRQ
jgi:hypothetical protein